MEERIITNTQMESYRQYLIREEKSTATVEKYLRDARAFVVYVGGDVVTLQKHYLLLHIYMLGKSVSYGNGFVFTDTPYFDKFHRIIS